MDCITEAKSRKHVTLAFSSSSFALRVQIEDNDCQSDVHKCQTTPKTVPGTNARLRMLDRLAVIVQRERRAFVVHDWIARIRQLMRDIAFQEKEATGNTVEVLKCE